MAQISSAAVHRRPGRGGWHGDDEDEIVGLVEHCPGLTVHTPLPKERDDVTARPAQAGVDANRADARPDRRARMASKAGQEVIAAQLTQHAHAKMRTWLADGGARHRQGPGGLSAARRRTR